MVIEKQNVSYHTTPSEAERDGCFGGVNPLVAEAKMIVFNGMKEIDNGRD